MYLTFLTSVKKLNLPIQDFKRRRRRKKKKKEEEDEEVKEL